ncbi:MAG: hypothetical protein ACK56F_19510 [bacterium]
MTSNVVKTLERICPCDCSSETPFPPLRRANSLKQVRGRGLFVWRL